MIKEKITAKSLRHLKQLVQIEMKIDGNACNLNHIDVSQISTMKSLFTGTEFNGDISQWDVSNVKDMSYMFYYSKFNNDISNWNVENVTDMTHMFASASFNRDLSHWQPYHAHLKDIFIGNKITKPYWCRFEKIDERKQAINMYQLNQKLENNLDTTNHTNKKIKI